MSPEEDGSNVGNVMSSIGLAISQFFTGKGATEEEELKMRIEEQEQGDDNTHVYTNLNDHDEEGNVKSRPEDRVPMPVSNKYTFGQKVEMSNAEHAR